MTFLELCQETARKCSITGSLTNVATATGELARVVGWVNEAWYDIQIAGPFWDWMRYEFSFQTVANQQEYSAVAAGTTDFSKWDEDSFRIYKTSIGVADEQFLPPWDYRTFRNTYQYATRNTGRPMVFAVKPRGKALLFGETPDAIYTVVGEYQRKAKRMDVVNASEPDMPDDFHMAIVHGARMKYAAFENAPEVMAEAVVDYDRVMSSMLMHETEELSTGAPLA